MQLKELLTEVPYPCFTQAFLLETDASGVGLGAVLSQEQLDRTIRPISFASRTLQPHEKNYGISELEALGRSSLLRGLEESPEHSSSLWQACPLGHGRKNST